MSSRRNADYRNRPTFRNNSVFRYYLENILKTVSQSMYLGIIRCVSCIATALHIDRGTMAAAKIKSASENIAVTCQRGHTDWGVGSFYLKPSPGNRPGRNFNISTRHRNDTTRWNLPATNRYVLARPVNVPLKVRI